MSGRPRVAVILLMRVTLPGHCGKIPQILSVSLSLLPWDLEGVSPVDACKQGSSRKQADGQPHSTAYCDHFLLSCCLLALPYRKRLPLQQNGRSVAACGCTGCHSVHGEARSTQQGPLCRGQHACARTSGRICTPTSNLPSLRLHANAGRHHWLPELTQLG